MTGNVSKVIVEGTGNSEGDQAVMMERCELIMIILKTNSEMKVTFERLIKTMKEPVEWSGRFVVGGDYLIIQGRVRSLFFNI